MLPDGGFCSEVGDFTRKEKKIGICELKLWGEAFVCAVLQAVGVCGHWTRSTVKEAVWAGTFKGLSGVVPEVGGGAEEESF